MIKKATILDISGIALMLTMMHKETILEIPKINTLKLIDKVNELLHKGIILIAIKDNKIIGSIAGMPVSDWWSDEEYLADAWFYVYPEHRKSDVAKKLSISFINIAKKAKIKIRLGHVFSGDLDRKDKFYERLGLVKAGSTYVER
jgi:GNAT superfamily N-acetyltransferase